MTITRSCLGCGTDVRPPASRCEVCENAQRRERRHAGYDDPRYRARRAGVKRRICNRCRLRNAETVHHRDGNPGNNRDSNLEDLCSTCATAADKEMRDARRTRRRRV